MRCANAGYRSTTLSDVKVLHCEKRLGPDQIAIILQISVKRVKALIRELERQKSRTP